MIVTENNNFSYDLNDKSNIFNERFLVDYMLWKLCKFLRYFGIDVGYIKEKNHTELHKKALEEKRIILTRDHSYFKKKLQAPCYFVEENSKSSV